MAQPTLFHCLDEASAHLSSSHTDDRTAADTTVGDGGSSTSTTLAVAAAGSSSAESDSGWPASWLPWSRSSATVSAGLATDADANASRVRPPRLPLMIKAACSLLCDDGDSLGHEGPAAAGGAGGATLASTVQEMGKRFAVGYGLCTLFDIVGLLLKLTGNGSKSGRRQGPPTRLPGTGKHSSRSGITRIVVSVLRQVLRLILLNKRSIGAGAFSAAFGVLYQQLLVQLKQQVTYRASVVASTTASHPSSSVSASSSPCTTESADAAASTTATNAASAAAPDVIPASTTATTASSLFSPVPAASTSTISTAVAAAAAGAAALLAYPLLRPLHGSMLDPTSLSVHVIVRSLQCLMNQQRYYLLSGGSDISVDGSGSRIDGTAVGSGAGAAPLRSAASHDGDADSGGSHQQSQSQALDAQLVALPSSTPSAPPSLTILPFPAAFQSMIDTLCRHHHHLEHASFITSCWVIMYCWFYRPASLPQSYRQWITMMASMDTTLLSLLRKMRTGEIRYGQKSDYLANYCAKHGVDPTLADFATHDQVPCRVIHPDDGDSCTRNVVRRYARGFGLAMAMYLPIHIGSQLMSHRSEMFRAVMDVVRDGWPGRAGIVGSGGSGSNGRRSGIGNSSGDSGADLVGNNPHAVAAVAGDSAPAADVAVEPDHALQVAGSATDMSLDAAGQPLQVTSVTLLLSPLSTKPTPVETPESSVLVCGDTAAAAASMPRGYVVPVQLNTSLHDAAVRQSSTGSTTSPIPPIAGDDNGEGDSNQEAAMVTAGGLGGAAAHDIDSMACWSSQLPASASTPAPPPQQRQQRLHYRQHGQQQLLQPLLLAITGPTTISTRNATATTAADCRLKLLSLLLRLLRHATASSVRSSTFISTVIGLVWGGVCVSRSSSLMRHDPSEMRGPLLGCFLSGFSIFIEAPHRRSELCAYVIPRALQSGWDLMLRSRFWMKMSRRVPYSIGKAVCDGAAAALFSLACALMVAAYQRQKEMTAISMVAAAPTKPPAAATAAAPVDVEAGRPAAAASALVISAADNSRTHSCN